MIFLLYNIKNQRNKILSNFTIGQSTKSLNIPL
jgi:hypothetical protein